VTATELSDVVRNYITARAVVGGATGVSLRISANLLDLMAEARAESTDAS
jgi:hypothetical protein